MKSMHRLVLAFVAVALLASATSASAALAAPEWYSSSASPEWRLSGAALTEATATKLKGKVKLSVEYETGKSVGMECEGAGEGSAGPGAVDAETKLSLSGCVTTAGTCPSPTMQVGRLPWHTELAIVEGHVNDLTTSGGSGAPNFVLACAGVIKDTCEGTLSAAMSNATGGVEAAFNGEKLKCSLGGKRGALQGTQLIEAAGGGKLEAVAVSKGFSKLTGALAVKGSGITLLEDTKGSLGVECHVEIEGTIETLGLGWITHYATPLCSGSGLCGSSINAEPLNLPWKTELYEAGGVIRERIVSGGSGTPEWSFTCKGGLVADRCGLNTNLAMSNSFEGNVEATFDVSSSRTNCSGGGAGSGKWLGALGILHPASVEAIEVKK